ncbi:MAG: beta-ketoacyl synthase chain length factor [Gammaproteobacteria bacterium]
MTGPEAWRAWLPGGFCADPAAQPDVSYLPSLLRRRLDHSGRMAMTTAWPCAAGLESVPSVFASRHGVLERTVELLTNLARVEPLSPTSFSLSVHNSSLGLFSIARSDRAAATAIAAGADSLGLALLEGALQIADGAERVLVCYADDKLPQPYSTMIEDVEHHPFSISLLLTRARDDAPKFRLSHSDTQADEAPEPALMRFLLDGSKHAVLGVDQHWRLERTHAG